MKKNKTLFLMIFIVGIVLLGIATFFMFAISSKNNTKSVINTPKPQEKITVQSWKTYSNKDFSFKYPSDWYLNSSKEIVTISSTNSASINILYFSFSKYGKNLTFETYVKQRFDPSLFAGPKNTKIGNKDINSYSAKQNGAWVNYITIPYSAEKEKGYEISLNFSALNPQLDYQQLFEQILLNFMFNK